MDLLIQNISLGNLEAVTQVLDEHPEYIDAPDNDGRTPLIHASWRGQLNIVNLLLERGSQAILTPDNGSSLPIHFAAQNGYPEILWRLLEATPVPPGDTLEASQKRHLLTPGNAGFTPFIFGLQPPNSSEFIVPLFRRAPEVFTHPRFTRRQGQFRDETYLELIQSAIELLDIEIVRTTIRQNCFELLLRQHDPVVIGEMLSLISAEVSTDQLYELMHRSQCAPPYLDLILSRIGPVNSLSLDRKIALLEAVVRIDNVEILNQLILDASEADQIKIFFERTPHYSILVKFAFSERAERILGRIVPIYLKFISDPFLRGQLYAHVISDSEIEKKLFQTNDATLVPFICDLFNGIAGPGFFHLRLSKFDSRGYLPIHLAIVSGRCQMVQMLLRFGSPYTNTSNLNNSVSPMQLILFHDDSIRSILRAVESPTSPEEIAIRHQIYFEDSLTVRLLRA